MNCMICGKEFSNDSALNSHWTEHAVRPVKKDPLSYLLILPNGIVSGSYEAAQAFADAYAELTLMHPDVQFNFFPFSFNGFSRYGEEHRDLNSILAIAK